MTISRIKKRTCFRHVKGKIRIHSETEIVSTTTFIRTTTSGGVHSTRSGSFQSAITILSRSPGDPRRDSSIAQKHKGEEASLHGNARRKTVPQPEQISSDPETCHEGKEECLKNIWTSCAALFQLAVRKVSSSAAALVSTVIAAKDARTGY